MWASKQRTSASGTKVGSTDPSLEEKVKEKMYWIFLVPLGSIWQGRKEEEVATEDYYRNAREDKQWLRPFPECTAGGLWAESRNEGVRNLENDNEMRETYYQR